MKTEAAKRGARTRRLKKRIASIVMQKRSAAFNEAFAEFTRENPNGLTGSAVRWFESAWRSAV